MPKRREPLAPYEFIRIIKYRDKRTGHFVARGKGGKREIYEALLDREGKVKQVIPVLTEHLVVKRTRSQALEEPRDPKRTGLIKWALAETNVFTQLKKARRLEIIVKGKDRTEQSRRFREVRNVEGERNLDELLPGMIAAMFHKRGWRTSYELNLVDWAKKRRRKGPSKKFSQSMDPLHGVEILVKIHR